MTRSEPATQQAVATVKQQDSGKGPERQHDSEKTGVGQMKHTYFSLLDETWRDTDEVDGPCRSMEAPATLCLSLGRDSRDLWGTRTGVT
jgi:hypothetical protein